MQANQKWVFFLQDEAGNLPSRADIIVGEFLDLPLRTLLPFGSIHGV